MLVEIKSKTVHKDIGDQSRKKKPDTEWNKSNEKPE